MKEFNIFYFDIIVAKKRSNQKILFSSLKNNTKNLSKQSHVIMKRIKLKFLFPTLKIRNKDLLNSFINSVSVRTGFDRFG